MKSITVRRASAPDLDALRRFQHGVVHAELAFDPTLRDGSIEYYDLDSMLSRDEVYFALAECGVHAAGCGFARLHAAKPYLKHRTQAYLGMMYVVPEYRGQGVNGLIIDALKAWCRSKSVAEIRLEAYARNAAALRAYEKAGFSQHIIEMRTAISGQDLTE